MGKYLTLFQSNTQYEEYKNGEKYLLPNVSFVLNGEITHFNPYVYGYELFETTDGTFCVKEGDFYVKIID